MYVMYAVIMIASVRAVIIGDLHILVHNRWARATHARLFSFQMRFDICLQLVCVGLASWADKEIVTVLAYSFGVLLDLLVIHPHAAWSFGVHSLLIWLDTIFESYHKRCLGVHLLVPTMFHTSRCWSITSVTPWDLPCEGLKLLVLLNI